MCFCYVVSNREYPQTNTQNFFRFLATGVHVSMEREPVHDQVHLPNPPTATDHSTEREWGKQNIPRKHYTPGLYGKM